MAANQVQVPVIQTPDANATQIQQNTNKVLRNLNNKISSMSTFNLQFFVSDQVTTRSSVIATNVFTKFSNSPAFTFTPTVAGKYEVYATIALYCNTATVFAQAKIIKTSGAGTLLYDNQIFSGNNGTDSIATATTSAVFTLTAGTEYVFDIQGASFNNNSGIFLVGDLVNFYMFSQLIG